MGLFNWNPVLVQVPILVVVKVYVMEALDLVEHQEVQQEVKKRVVLMQY